MQPQDNYLNLKINPVNELIQQLIQFLINTHYFNEVILYHVKVKWSNKKIDVITFNQSC